FVAGGAEIDYLASSEIFRPLAKGAPCAVDGECASGHCVDGVCCDGGCKAACYACSAAKKGSGGDGVCGPVAAEAEPSGRCNLLVPSSCGTTGMCNGVGGCSVYPEGTVCAPLTCAVATLSESRCDGLGACVPKTTNCAPFACATPTTC